MRTTRAIRAPNDAIRVVVEEADHGLQLALVMGKATRQLTTYAGTKLARRLARSIPWIGAAIAIATLGQAIRRKGMVRGTLHTGLDAIPFVGGAKIFAELVRGRDFLPDKR